MTLGGLKQGVTRARHGPRLRRPSPTAAGWSTDAEPGVSPGADLKTHVPGPVGIKGIDETGRQRHAASARRARRSAVIRLAGARPAGQGHARRRRQVRHRQARALGPKVPACSARPARPRTTATPGSSAGPSSTRSPSGSATPTRSSR